MSEFTCLICLEVYNTSTPNIKYTPCIHGFHDVCLDNWMNYKQNMSEVVPCPVCKTDITELHMQKIFINIINKNINPGITINTEDPIENGEMLPSDDDEDLIPSYRPILFRSRNRMNRTHRVPRLNRYISISLPTSPVGNNTDNSSDV
jgi:hypothetical protein